jgi:hypothetical protein
MRMSTLSMSFILVFLQSLALDYELLVSYTFMKHVVVYFIIVRIILFITKLLFILTFWCLVAHRTEIWNKRPDSLELDYN